MKKSLSIAAILLSINTYSQTIKLESSRLEAVKVYMSIEKLMGTAAIKVVKDSSVKAADEPTFVKIKGVDFKNGIIEVKVLSR